MQVIHCTGHVSAIPSPHQLCWGDREMETFVHKMQLHYTWLALSKMSVEALQRHRHFMELSIVRRS